MPLKILWTPRGITLDAIGQKRLVSISDGDTPNIRMNVRMLSIDTPESRATGAIRNVDELNEWFAKTADWIESGDSPVSEPLATFLVPRLRRDGASTEHLNQGKEAKLAFEALPEQRLKRPTGSTRPLFVRVADEPFDRYGRLLAYVAPNYSKQERAELSRRERATFNFSMVELGWAATFIIFPSIPGELDLPMFREAGMEAVEQGKGAWADDLALTGYEFRSSERLAALCKKVKEGKKLAPGEWTGWISRYCCDMTTGGLFAPQEYVKVEPYNRIFIWRDDVRRAVGALNLTPQGALSGA